MMSPKAPRKIRVFIASPSDLESERLVFRNICQELNEGFGDGAGIRFEPLGWEDTLSSVGRRNQSVINQEIDCCDVFVLVLYRRWGQRAPDSRFSSYTEEEFHRALDRLRHTKAPEIFVFFKHVDPGQMADPGPQLKRVLSFRAELENTRQVIYRMFSDDEQFGREVDQHLRKFAKGNLPPRDLAPQPLILPIELRQQIRAAQEDAERQADRAKKSDLFAAESLARADSLALTLAERAAAAAAEGRIEQARQDFAKAVVDTSSRQVLELASKFYHNTGELHAAKQLLMRHLALLGNRDTLARGHLLQELGNIYCEVGDLPRAKQMALEALAIYRALDEESFVAQQNAEIAVIYARQGRISESRAALKCAIDKFIELERVDDCLVALNNYACLASSLHKPEMVQMAEDLLQKTLACEEKAERTDGIARVCLNLGLVYLQQEKLESAEAVVKRALELSEAEGRLDAVMREYGAIALIAKKRGDQERQEQMIERARDIAVSIGRGDMQVFFDEWLRDYREIALDQGVNGDI